MEDIKDLLGDDAKQHKL